MADYAPPPGEFGGGWTVEVDASGNLGFYHNGTEVLSFSATGSFTCTITSPQPGNLGIAAYNGSGEVYWSNTGLFIQSAISALNGKATAGLGVPAEYASTLTTPVTLGASSTAITSYTPTAAGLFLVIVTVTPQTAFSKTGTITVTYTDGTLAASATQTQNIASTASAVPQSFQFLCNATTASSIAVAGTISTANDAVASAAIFAL